MIVKVKRPARSVRAGLKAGDEASRGLKKVKFSARLTVMNRSESSCPMHRTGDGASPAAGEAGLREALLASEEKNRAILDTAVNAIITMDEQCLIDSVNPAAVRMFGYSREEMLGQNVKMLMADPFQREHDSFVQRYLRTGEKRIIGIGREVVARRKDGSLFPVDLSVGEARLPHGRLFTGIIRDISDRKELEEKILEISEEEQHRIGQDIHDDLCQQLAAIGCLAQVSQQILRKSSHPEAESLSEIVRLITQANVRAREMSRGLVPVVLDEGGLMVALRELARTTSGIFGVACVFVCEDEVLVHDNKTAVQLYRIAQEAVANAVKHSQASRITISLAEEDLSWKLTVQDNGKGIQPDGGAGRGRGLGLLTMTHRAKMLGGSATVTSEPGKGTLVTCLAPFLPVSTVEAD